MRSEGNISLKNPVTPPGIDPGTVELVAQRLYHYATPGPNIIIIFPNFVDVSDGMTSNKCSSVYDYLNSFSQFHGLYSRNDGKGRIEKICHGELK